MSENMQKIEGEQVQLKPEDIDYVTSPLDARTLFVDGIKGVAVLNGIVRISFVENVLDTQVQGDDKSIKARHVVTLATSISSLGGFLELLNKVHADVKGQQHDG
jgi:hypothetical protein